MMQWLPLPQLSLMAIWLLFNQSLAPGHILLGAILGLAGPWFLRRLDVPQALPKRPMAALRLIGRLIVDIFRSNIKVAEVILRNDPERRPGFVPIPLRMRSPYSLACLACIITATPGTSWVTHNPDTGLLIIHVLDLVDDDDWAAIITSRYETLLMEIFE